MEQSWQQRVAQLATDPSQRPALLAELRRKLPDLAAGERLLALGVVVELELALQGWEAALVDAGRLSALAVHLGRASHEALARLHAARALEGQGRLNTATDVLQVAIRQAERAPEDPIARKVMLKASAVWARVAARRGHAGRARALSRWLGEQELPEDPELHAGRIYGDLDPRELIEVLLEIEEPLLAPVLAELAGAVPELQPQVRERLARLGRDDLAATFVSAPVQQALAQSRPADALAMLDEVREAGPDWLRATLAIDEARASSQIGDYAAAVQVCDEALPLLVRQGFDAHAVLALLEAARAQQRLGADEAALSRLVEAQQRATALGQPVLAGTVQLERAQALRSVGHPEQAARLAHALDVPHPALQARRAALLAQLALDSGEPDAAQRQQLLELADRIEAVGLGAAARDLRDRLR